MGEMEDKLNAILNDPSAMGQIMALAQSLGGGAPRPQASPAGEAAQGAEQTGAREAEAPASAGSAPPALTGGEEPLAKLDRAVQISRLARVIRVLFRGMGEGGRGDV